jgi:tetratricopeptide (TPR) repeat protein
MPVRTGVEVCFFDRREISVELKHDAPPGHEAFGQILLFGLLALRQLSALSRTPSREPLEAWLAALPESAERDDPSSSSTLRRVPASALSSSGARGLTAEVVQWNRGISFSLTTPGAGIEPVEAAAAILLLHRRVLESLPEEPGCREALAAVGRAVVTLDSQGRAAGPRVETLVLRLVWAACDTYGVRTTPLGLSRGLHHLLEDCPRPAQGVEIRPHAEGSLAVLSGGTHPVWLRESAWEIYRLCDGTRSTEEVLETFAAHFGENDAAVRKAAASTLAELLAAGVLVVHAPRGDTAPEDASSVWETCREFAKAYEAKGNFDEAADLWAEAARAAGEFRQDDPRLGIALSQLASVRVAQGRLAEAEPHLRRAATLLDRALGLEHPETLDVLARLGVLCGDRGKVAEAETLLRRVLSVREGSLGANHPLLSDDMVRLAALLRAKRRLEEAEALVDRSLDLLEARYGAGHPRLADALSLLCAIRFESGRPREAEEPCRHALKIRDAALGPDHPDTARAMQNLSSVLHRLDRDAEAEPLCRRLLSSQERLLGRDHPGTLRVAANLGWLWVRLNRYPMAEPVLDRVYQARAALPTSALLTIASAYETLAAAYHGQGREAEALDFESRARGLRSHAPPGTPRPRQRPARDPAPARKDEPPSGGQDVIPLHDGTLPGSRRGASFAPRRDPTVR